MPAPRRSSVLIALLVVSLTAQSGFAEGLDATHSPGASRDAHMMEEGTSTTSSTSIRATGEPLIGREKEFYGYALERYDTLGLLLPQAVRRLELARQEFRQVEEQLVGSIRSLLGQTLSYIEPVFADARLSLVAARPAAESVRIAVRSGIKSPADSDNYQTIYHAATVAAFALYDASSVIDNVARTCPSGLLEHAPLVDDWCFPAIWDTMNVLTSIDEYAQQVLDLIELQQKSIAQVALDEIEVAPGYASQDP